MNKHSCSLIGRGFWRGIVLFFLFFSPLLWRGAGVFAQDIHLSQFNSCPQNLNPAQTGVFDGDWRFVGNYRSQWSAIPVPYKTFSLSTDTRLKTKLQNDVPAVGLILNTDRAGDSKFSTTQILMSAAYIKKLNKDSTHFISVGIQPGITSKSFNVNALTFDSQYDGDRYNSALGSGENFSKTKITYFDLGGGLVYLWKKNQRTQINVGISRFHLTKPKQSFFNDLIPTFLYQKQGKFNETVLGMFGKYYLKPIDGMTTAVSLGGFYRLKDAFILVANMDYRSFNVGVSYDVNLSKLVAATNNRGGFEISVIYIFKKPLVFVAKKRVCPIYM
jgi:type IX secretion system PorP/SprF family membrane protein